MTSKMTFRSSLLVASLVLAAPAAAEIGHYVGELLDGHRKVCFYETTEGTFAVNIEAADQCPITYEFLD